jgi:transcriptional regulator with XRE-family HTH domain
VTKAERQALGKVQELASGYQGARRAAKHGYLRATPTINLSVTLLLANTPCGCYVLFVVFCERRTDSVKEMLVDRDTFNKRQRQAFAKQLQRAIVDRGWNQSELARRVTENMPQGGKMSRDLVSSYIRERNLPLPVHLNALSKTLGIPPEVLLPTDRGRLLSTSMDDTEGDLAVDIRRDGTAHLRMDQKVSASAAMQILRILSEDAEIRKNIKGGSNEYS